jgi:hypothetical protein
MYYSGANMVRTDKIENVNNYLLKKKTEVLNTPKLLKDWEPVGAKVSADIAGRTFDNRNVLSSYYQALGNGFKGGQ